MERRAELPVRPSAPRRDDAAAPRREAEHRRRRALPRRTAGKAHPARQHRSLPPDIKRSRSRPPPLRPRLLSNAPFPPDGGTPRAPPLRRLASGFPTRRRSADGMKGGEGLGRGAHARVPRCGPTHRPAGALRPPNSGSGGGPSGSGETSRHGPEAEAAAGRKVGAEVGRGREKSRFRL